MKRKLNNNSEKEKQKKHIITVILHTSSNELWNCNDMVLPRTEKIFFK